MIPQPDVFDVAYGRWRVSGLKATGWIAWQLASVPGTRGHWNRLHHPKHQTLDEATAALRMRMDDEPGPDSDAMHVVLDTLSGVGGWGWPILPEPVKPAPVPVPVVVPGAVPTHAWVGNPRVNGWLLFVSGQYVASVRTSEVYAKRWADVKGIFDGRIRELVPASVLGPVMQELETLSFPGAPNEVAGPCRACAGSGVVRVQVMCERCGGRGDDVLFPRGR